jgi:imidazolonepropionase-like amidohydrolase
MLVERAEHNLEQAERTLLAARAAGVRLAMGFDWLPHPLCAIELVRMAHHGLTNAEAIVAATAGGAYALGLGDTIGRIAPGLIADLLIVDGDPLAEPTLLLDPARIWLVVQLGAPVAGRSLEADPRRA